MRVYQIDLNDPPGMHYVGEDDLILQFELHRTEVEVVRWVPKPGRPSEKIPIHAHRVQHSIQFHRLIAGWSWITRGLPVRRNFKLSSSLKYRIFENEWWRLLDYTKHVLSRPLHDSNGRSTSVDIAEQQLESILESMMNRRSSLVLNYLQRFYSDPPNVEETVMMLEKLVPILLSNHGMTDRRHWVHLVLHYSDLKSLIDHWHRLFRLDLPSDDRLHLIASTTEAHHFWQDPTRRDVLCRELFWTDEAVVRHLLGRTIFSSTHPAPPPVSNNGTLIIGGNRFGSIPTIEWGGVVERVTGEMSGNWVDCLVDTVLVVQKWLDRIRHGGSI
jgi:hypothetical protein